MARHVGDCARDDHRMCDLTLKFSTGLLVLDSHE